MESGRVVVDLVRTGLDGHQMAMTVPYDLIILYVMLPDVDGWRIVQALRDAESSTPVPLSTERGNVEDRAHAAFSSRSAYYTKVQENTCTSRLECQNPARAIEDD